MSDSNSFPMGSMIEQYKRLEEHVAAETARFTESIKPFQDAMDTINGYIKGQLLEQGLQNFKSDAGTAYLSHTLSVKVVDRDTFLDFVRDVGAWHMLDVRALKEPVKEWRETAGPEVSANDIGLKIEPIVKCNIRKG